EKQIEVNENEVIPVDVSGRTIEMPGMSRSSLETIALADGSTVEVDRSQLGLAKPDVLPEMFEYYIVSQALYEKLGDPVKIEHYYDWQVTKGEKENVIQAGETISDEIIGNVMAIDYLVYIVNKT